MKKTMEAQFGERLEERMPAAMLAGQRQRLCSAFLDFCGGQPGRVLEVVPRTGLASPQGGWLGQCLEGQQGERVLSCAIDVGGSARLRFARGDGRHLPFRDAEFDWVFCHEALEQAGGFERQLELLKELSRVARRGVFVATPNRWHPIEFHTALPFLHWLPAAWWRRLLKFGSRRAWAAPAALNLQDARGLLNLASLLPGGPKADVGHIRLGGIKAHLFLMLQKKAASAAPRSADLPVANC